MRRPPIVLSIAGSDPSGGAGIQADIKTISACGCYAFGVPAALTVQNTQGVFAVSLVEPDFLAAQIDALFSDAPIDAVKIGMTGAAATIRIIADRLRHWRARNIVFDPVMASSSGYALAQEDLAQAMRAHLFPLASLITPNLSETARLAHSCEADAAKDGAAAAHLLRRMGAKAVLVKGGHGGGAESIDYLCAPEGDASFAAPRLSVRNDHGTGCALSSAIASHLARGAALRDAVAQAKDYLSQALARADEWTVGQGRGSLMHFHAFTPQ